MTPQSLRKTRKKYDLSQFAVAKASGVSRYMFSLFECGYTTLSIVNRKKLKIGGGQKTHPASATFVQPMPKH